MKKRDCTQCGGSGANHDPDYSVCETCKGDGVEMKNISEVRIQIINKRRSRYNRP